MNYPIRKRSYWLLAVTLLVGLGLLFLIPVLARAQSRNQTAPTGSSKVAFALAYLKDNRDQLGLRETDLADFVVTDEYLSGHTGVTHLYLLQRYDGIEVFNAVINLNITPDGQVISVGNRFVADLANAIQGNPLRLSAEQAVLQGAAQSRIEINAPLVEHKSFGDPAQTVVFSKEGLALEDITARLVYQPLKSGELRLAWDFAIYELDAQNWWSMRVDATDGRLLSRHNLVALDTWGDAVETSPSLANPNAPGTFSSLDNRFQMIGNQAPLSPDSYLVYPAPMESPNHLIPPDPDDPPLNQDHRSQEVDPANPIASPFGWHDTNGAAGAEYTITRGNNAHAYEDTSANNSSAGNEPDGGATLVFSYTLDLTLTPGTYQDASVTNLFYWNNIIHDVFYQYGFDESSGNFQENNYGNGGLGSDYVYAEAQDGLSNCNANFATPSDGSNPRMQMFTCNSGSPTRDGDLDNGVIIHEYGHGISNRLTGGPSSSSCLFNAEQMGEGWSDFLGLWTTIEQGDAAADSRGMGTYLLGQPSTGSGIRPAPYSTNFGVNAFTYGNIGSLAIPHGVGFVWATMLWDLNWALINQYGFDPDIYSGTGGNNIALQLVMDGMKLQPCSPGFVDGRDAILQADLVLYGGANQCTIWQAFANRGLGFSAAQGSSASTADGSEAFDLPPACLQTLKLSKTSDPATVNPGGIITYTLVASNDTVGALTDVTITDTLPLSTTLVPGSISSGGTESTAVVSYPPVALNSGQSITRTFQVYAGTHLGSVEHFSDDFESGLAGWTMTGLWNIESESDTCGAAVSPFPSSSNALYYGQDGICTYNTGIATSGELTTANPIDLTGADSATLKFWSYETTEDFANFDRRFVDISINGGTSWTELQELTTEGSWYQKSVDLSPYIGNNILIRFRFNSIDNLNNAYFGWMVDDIKIVEEHNIYNKACVRAAQGDSACAQISTLVAGPVALIPGVDLSGDAAQSADPGAALSYSVRITNTGNTIDTFGLSVSGNTWNVTPPAVVGPLAVGSSTTFTVTVDIPASAVGGGSDTASLIATSQNDGSGMDTLDLTSTANNIYGIGFSSDMALTAAVGTTVTYTMRVTNTGNASDTYNLGVSANQWSVNAPASIGPLGAGDSVNLDIQVLIAPNTIASTTDIAALKLTSTADSSVTVQRFLTTTARSATYQIYLPLLNKK